MNSPSSLSLLVSKYQSSYREQGSPRMYILTSLMSKKYQSNISSYRVFNPVNNNNYGDAHNRTYFIRITYFYRLL